MLVTDRQKVPVHLIRLQAALLGNRMTSDKLCWEVIYDWETLVGLNCGQRVFLFPQLTVTTESSFLARKLHCYELVPQIIVMKKA
jgi:hypothetical protein